MAHSSEIALDTRAALFLNVYRFHLVDFELRDGRVWVRPFQKDVCFAHGNGASILAINLRELQLDGSVQPSHCSFAVEHGCPEGQAGPCHKFFLYCDKDNPSPEHKAIQSGRKS